MLSMIFVLGLLILKKEHHMYVLQVSHDTY